MELDEIAPWWNEGGKLWMAIRLDETSLFVVPTAKPINRIDTLEWEVPVGLSKPGWRHVLSVMRQESDILRTGWAVVKGKLQLDREAVEAKGRLDEFFALLMKHPGGFVDQVQTADAFLEEMGEGGWADWLQDEGDVLLAVIAIGQWSLEHRIRLLGDLSESVYRLGWDKTLI